MAEGPVAGGKPTILFVTHNIVGRQPFGGVEVYQQVVQQGLADRFTFLTLTRVPGGNGNAYELLDGGLQTIDRFTVAGSVDEGMLRNVEIETLFTMLLRRYDVALVHFQHLLGFVPSLAQLARTLGIRTVYTAHDYYTLCSHYNLMDPHGRSCIDHFTRIEHCDVCLNTTRGIPYGAQRLRRNAFADMLEHIDLLLFPSRAARDLVAEVYPSEVKRARSAVLGQPIIPMPRLVAGGPVGKPLKVAVYGNFSFNKGADLLVEVFRSLRGRGVEFHLFGRVDAPYDGVLAQEDFADVVQHGPFPPGQPPAVLGEMAVSLHLSNWPETYCMTLSEAWLMGLVPVVTDIGALGERVVDGVNGFKVPLGDAGAVERLLASLATDASLVERARAGIAAQLTVTPEAHCGQLAELYQALLPEHCGELAGRGLDRPDICKVATLGHIGLDFLPDRWWTPAPAYPAASLIEALSGNRVRKFVQYTRRYGVGYAISRAWAWIRYRFAVR
ncbi:MAG TPA: glycosyltransferase [Azospirillum sp.]|nr:glycosyltransferase [Azospirillum sp.]